MRRAYRYLLAVAVVSVSGGAIVMTPRVLPALPGFDVRRVEVSGTELLSPREVLRATGIQRDQSIWEDPARWESALERHAVIESARIRRELPWTLRVEVEEKTPVAYLAGEVLAPVTASGERLPIDPTRAPADLPIVRTTEGKVPPTLLRETERLARMDAALLAGVSEIRPGDDEGKVLVLRHRTADIVIPAGATADRLIELRAVLADLEGRLGGGDAGGVARIDLRFADQVVVRLPPSVQKP